MVDFKIVFKVFKIADLKYLCILIEIFEAFTLNNFIGFKSDYLII